MPGHFQPRRMDSPLVAAHPPMTVASLIDHLRESGWHLTLAEDESS
jgi:hypothetical protein